MIVKLKEFIFLCKFFSKLNNISICILLNYIKNYNKKIFYDFSFFYLSFFGNGIFSFFLKLNCFNIRKLHLLTKSSRSMVVFRFKTYRNTKVSHYCKFLLNFNLPLILNFCRYTLKFYLFSFGSNSTIARYVFSHEGLPINLNYSRFYFPFLKNFYKSGLFWISSFYYGFLPFAFSLFKTQISLRRYFARTFSAQVESLLFYPYYFSYICGVESPLRFLLRVNIEYLLYIIIERVRLDDGDDEYEDEYEYEYEESPFEHNEPFEDPVILDFLLFAEPIVDKYPFVPFYDLQTKVFYQFYIQILKLLSYNFLGAGSNIKFYPQNFSEYSLLFNYSLKSFFTFNHKVYNKKKAVMVISEKRVNFSGNLSFFPFSHFLGQIWPIWDLQVKFLYQVDFNLKPSCFYNFFFLLNYYLKLFFIYKNLFVLVVKLPVLAEKRNRGIPLPKLD